MPSTKTLLVILAVLLVANFYMGTLNRIQRSEMFHTFVHFNLLENKDSDRNE